MATEIIKRVVDDLTGEPADGTVDFSINGKRYAIDLSKASAKKFEDALAPYVNAARPQGKVAGTKRTSQKSSAPAPKIDPDQLAVIREWARGKERSTLADLAKEAGLIAPDRGRLSTEILAAAYNAANPTKRTAKAETDESLFSSAS